MAKCPDIICITEFVPNILYFATVRPGVVPQHTPQTHYFSIDEELVYENYYSDFGPLNLACIYKYCKLLSHKLKQHSNKQIIVHYTYLDPKKKTNAAFLLGCYGILYLGLSPREAFRNLSAQAQCYKPFQDATLGESSFTISLLDCLQAIKKARNLGFFSFRDFDCNEYERLSKIQGGDLNWIVPGKFLAFIGPVDYRVSLFHPPEMYVDYFLKNNVKVVIRLNKRMYDANVFKKNGISHIDLFYPDGSCPPRHILFKFLQISEETEGAIAVHCKAGLGRTGTLISCYLIKHYKMSAHEAIAWIRVCRSGSVIGHQQEWLERLESWLLKQGTLYRNRKFGNPDQIPTHDFGIYSILQGREEEGATSFQSNSFHTPSPLLPTTIDAASELISPQSSKQHDESRDEIFLASCDLTVQEDDKSRTMKGYVIRNGSSTDYPNYNESDRVSREIPLWKKFLSFKHFGDGCDDILWKLAVGCCRVAPRRYNASKCCDLLDKRIQKERHERHVKPLVKVKNSEYNLREPVECNKFNRRINVDGGPRVWGTCVPVRPQPLVKISSEVTQKISINKQAKSPTEDKPRAVKQSMTITPCTSNREQQSKVASRIMVTVPSHPIPRRLLGRSPSPPPRRCVFWQNQSNSLETGCSRNNVKNPPKDNVTMGSSVERAMRAASVGAASLDARRDAPAQPFTASARSDQRTFATQGDMLNSIKLQRRIRESIQLECTKPTKKETPRNINSRTGSFQKLSSPSRK